MVWDILVLYEPSHAYIEVISFDQLVKAAKSV